MRCQSLVEILIAKLLQPPGPEAIAGALLPLTAGPRRKSIRTDDEGD